VTITGNASIPTDYGLVEGVTVQNTPDLRARGSVLQATIADKRSPIAYGYADKLAVYFNQAPVFSVTQFGGFGGGGRGGVQTPPEMRPRVVVRFAPENELFVSGMLAGGRALANSPAVIDAPLGKGLEPFVNTTLSRTGHHRRATPHGGAFPRQVGEGWGLV
jgi:hypothetical protein